MTSWRPVPRSPVDARRAGPPSGATSRPGSTDGNWSTSSTLFPREQVHVIRYRSLVEEPGRTLDAVCRFLGVDEGVITEVPARNVGGYVAPDPPHEIPAARLPRTAPTSGSHFPPQVWRKASIPLHG